MQPTHVRIPEETFEHLKNLAQARDTTVSSLLREALDPYVRGERPIPREERPKIRSTSFLWSEEEVQRFKEVSREQNKKFDEALRVIIKTYLAEMTDRK